MNRMHTYIAFRWSSQRLAAGDLIPFGPGRQARRRLSPLRNGTGTTQQPTSESMKDGSQANPNNVVQLL